VQDAVFGDVNDGSGPNYRSLGWIRASVLLVKTQIGLGVLGMPTVLTSVGLVPGIILILVIAALSTFCAYAIGLVKARHPAVYSVADVGYLMGGRFGRELFGAFYMLMLGAVAGAGMLSIATAFNAITDNAGCSVAWTVVGAVLTFAFSSFRELGKVGWLGFIGFVSIMTAVIVLTIAVGVQDRPSSAPQVGPWDPQVIIVGNPSFLDAMTAVSTIIFSFAGAPNFFNIISEMRRPEDYNKALALCQTVVIFTYVIIGAVVYRFCGIYVSSPALGSAGPLLKKVCYGIALPGLIVGCVLNTHMPAKYVFLRFMKKSPYLNTSGWQHWGVWLACVLGCTTFSFLIAEAIPFFDSLVSLIGALLSTFLSLIVEAAMFLWLQRELLRRREQRTKLLLGLCSLSAFIVMAGLFTMIAGTVSSIIGIHNTLKNGDTSP
ncbi:transmembrane amino acid transporter protein-domain-containing protein, partial [Leucosporidium creatinivorum]